MKRLGLAALILTLGAGAVGATTITFDGINLDPAAHSYQEQGVTVTGNGDLGMYTSGALHFDDGGTSAQSWATFSMATPFQALGFDLDPIAFNLHICDAYRVCTSPTYLNVSVQGYRGAELIASLIFDMGSSSDPYRVLLGSSFTNLTALTLSILPNRMPWGFNADGSFTTCDSPCSHFIVDNVELSPVPLPASLPAAVLALAAMWWGGRVRRRQI